jgi:hypothetical protein
MLVATHQMTAFALGMKYKTWGWISELVYFKILIILLVVNVNSEMLNCVF